MSTTPEQLPSSPEQHIDSHEAAAEQLEKLDKAQERAPEVDQKNVEKEARKEAEEQAANSEKEAKAAEKQLTARQAPAKRRGGISKKEQERSFKHNIKRVQDELTPGARTFSKVIHNRAVETASDVVGGTVARPNAILAGAVSAFILVLAIYIVSKTFGYPLSGFETIGAFIIGWVLGIVYDYLRLVITGKKS